MQRFKTVLAFLLVGWVLQPRPVRAYTANKVWFTFLDDGSMRIRIRYTVPELKELRESTIRFTSRRLAESAYWKLIRGANFYLSDAETGIRFDRNTVEQPIPW